jgi:predicted metalloprotease with PDZ domain
VLVALDGLRVTAANLDTLLSRYGVGSEIDVHAFRRDELMTFTATLQGDRVPGISLTVDAASKKAGTPQRPSQAG